MDAEAVRQQLWSAVEAFDAEGAELAIASLVWDVPLSGAVTRVFLPFLQEIGDRWEAGTLSVAHEHFASDMLRRQMSAIAAVPAQGSPGSDEAARPVVLLACPPGERHDLVLLCVTLMLRERGVRVRFLGADVPIAAIRTAARAMAADALVLAAIRPTTFVANSAALRRLGQDHPLYVAGRGADAETAAEIGATRLPDDPVRAVVVLVGVLSRIRGSW